MHISARNSIYTVIQKKTKPLLHLQTAAQNLTQYQYFILENRQRVFSLKVSNCRVLIKLGTSCLSPWQSSAADDVTIGLCEEDPILMKEIFMSSMVMQRRD